MARLGKAGVKSQVEGYEGGEGKKEEREGRKEGGGIHVSWHCPITCRSRVLSPTVKSKPKSKMLQERSQWLHHWTTPRRRHQLASTCAEQFRSTSTELFQISLEVPVRELQAMGEKFCWKCRKN